jgi:hypothetical protein
MKYIGEIGDEEQLCPGRRGCDCMVVGFTITCAISA